jgi:hypothetical protein
LSGSLLAVFTKIASFAVSAGTTDIPVTANAYKAFDVVGVLEVDVASVEYSLADSIVVALLFTHVDMRLFIVQVLIPRI